MRAAVALRPRTPDDLPALVALVAAQQPLTAYPLRWPLPFPVEDFVVRPTERVAWVAELDGAVVGHVAVAAPGEDLRPVLDDVLGPGAALVVSVLVVAHEHAGRGVGGALLDRAVAWVREQGRVPALDVVPTHERAVGLYRSRGWREVGRLHPDWLPDGRPDLLVMALGGAGTGV